MVLWVLSVGVYLQDAEISYAGNLTVFPGSHHLLQSHVRQDELGSLSLVYKGAPKPSPHPLLFFHWHHDCGCDDGDGDGDCV